MSDFYDAEPHDMDVNPDGTWANSELGIALAQLVDGGEEKTVYDRLQSTFSAEMNFWERMLVLNANFTFQKAMKITTGIRLSIALATDRMMFANRVQAVLTKAVLPNYIPCLTCMPR